MRAWPEKKRRHARIEIIPMIDVMMFLLVFFVLISINVLPALGLRISPPSSAKPDQVVEKQRVMIGIDRDNNTSVDGQPVTLEELPARLAGISDPEKKLVVIIAGDATANMQNLVNVLDVLKVAGIGSAQIVSKPK